MLGNLARELDETGNELRLANVRASVLDLMSRAGVLDVVGEENIYADVAAGTLDYLKGREVESSDIEAVVLRMSQLASLVSRHTGELTTDQIASMATLQRDLESALVEINKQSETGTDSQSDTA